MPPRTCRMGTTTPIVLHGSSESNGPMGNAAQILQVAGLAAPGVDAAGTRPTRKSTKLPILLGVC